ncbi:Serine/threonine protein kinase [Quillaja saponaria]|uniref:Serine/threonine protein kinase n=1 Tax=Quillaja saponaria TaxID=32244 RepID=A0AAD7Q056_QUISA|nr:Serine/threonine protein kinase [Quillaja saponaria]
MKIPCYFPSCFSSQPAIDQSRHDPGGHNDGNFRLFTYNELKSATNSFHFSNKVGQGGFGSVYKGRLRDGVFVAAKVLAVEPESMRGEREFIAELAALSDIKHENLVPLRGCCVEGANRYLVYDYMENNSLTQSLLGGEQNRMKFSWDVRRKVSIGVACGLRHLHEEVKPHIVHRDIKARNILLDQNFNPRVSDFGLAKLLGEEHSHISTRVAGTMGYLAPEYAVTGHLTRKSDVYSFGVLLLEIVTGQAVVDLGEDYKEHFLVEKAWEAYQTNSLLQMVDPILSKDFHEEEAIMFLKLGLLCVQETSSLRPRMSVAVEILTKTRDIRDVPISKPGFIADFMKIKMARRHSLQESSSSGPSSNYIWSPAKVGR